MAPVTVPDLADLAARFHIFLIDQFGVLHDGTAPYPGAVDALARLKARGKTVVLLSNSGKRAVPNEKRLLALGFAPESWDVFLSSGEVAWRDFAGELGAPRLPAGTRCLLIARDGDRSAVEGLGLTLVDNGAEAEIVLLTASEGDRFDLDHYRALLEPAARAGVRCVCTNPDKIMLTPVGPRFGAGRIAELYEELGGIVAWIGKPFPAIYQAALHATGHPDPARVVGIGDSIEHDIAGAKAAGLSAALVRSGVLAELAPADLDALYEAHGARPDYVLPAFLFPSS